MPGPPPSKNPRRRNARPDIVRLPAAGRHGDPPPWPLGGRTTKAVRALWAELWSTPQAVEWERLGWTRIVARYTVKVLVAEEPDSLVSLQAEVRQLEDRLGLTSMSMKRLQWEVVHVAPTEVDVEQPSAEVTQLDEYRDLYGAGAG